MAGWSTWQDRILSVVRAVRKRGQSETLAVALLTGIVIILSVTVGLFLFADFGADDNEQLLANINADITASNLTLDHEGGDTFEPANIVVVLRGDTTAEYTLGADFSEAGNRAGRLEPGDSWRNQASSLILGEGRLLVIHEPTNTVLLDTPYAVETAENGVSLLMTDWVTGPNGSATNTDRTTIYEGPAWNYSVQAQFPDGSTLSVDPADTNFSFDDPSKLSPTGTGNLSATDSGTVTATVGVDRPGVNGTDSVDVTIFDDIPSPNITKDNFNVVAGEPFDVPVEVTGVTGTQGVDVVVDPEVDSTKTKSVQGGSEIFTFQTSSSDAGDTYTIVANLTANLTASDTANLAVQSGVTNITVGLPNGQTKSGSVKIGPSVGTTNIATASTTAQGEVTDRSGADSTVEAGADSDTGADTNNSQSGATTDASESDHGGDSAGTNSDSPATDSSSVVQDTDSSIVGAGDGDFTVHGSGGPRDVDTEESDILTQSGGKLLDALGVSISPNQTVDVSGEDYVRIDMSGAGGGGGTSKEDEAWSGGDGGRIEEGIFEIDDFKKIEFYKGLGGDGGPQSPTGTGDGGGGYADGGDGAQGGSSSEPWATSGAGGGATAAVGVYPNGSEELLALAAGGGGGAAVASDGPSFFVEDKSSSGGGGGPFGLAGVRISYSPLFVPVPPWTGGPGEDGEFIPADPLGISGGDGGNTYIEYNGPIGVDWLVDGDPGLPGGTVVDTNYIVSATSIIGGGANGGSGGESGNNADDGDDGSYNINTGFTPEPIEIAEIDGPTAIETDADLITEYMIEKTKQANGPVDVFVDLFDTSSTMGFTGTKDRYILNNITDSDMDLTTPLTVPANTDRYNGTLLYEGGSYSNDSIDNYYSEGDTIEWSIEVYNDDEDETVDTVNSTTYYGNPLRLNLSNTPDRISPNESLSVTYNLTNVAGIDQTVELVNLSIWDNSKLADDNQFVTVNGDDSTFGQLVYSNVTSDYSVGDTVEYGVELAGAVGATDPLNSSYDPPWEGLVENRTVDVVEPANLTVTADAPDSIDITDTSKLVVNYTVENVGNLSTVDDVRLFNESMRLTTERISLGPTDGSASTATGTLNISGIDTKFDAGDTITWTVNLSNGNGSVTGTTNVTQKGNITIQSLNVPDQVAPNETLTVNYTLEEQNGIPGNGTVDFVDLQIYNTTSDTDVTNTDVSVPGGGTTNGTLEFDVNASKFTHNDTMRLNLSLSAPHNEVSSDRTVNVTGTPEFELEKIQIEKNIVEANGTLPVKYWVKNNGTAPGNTTVTVWAEGNRNKNKSSSAGPIPPGEYAGGSSESDGWQRITVPMDKIEASVGSTGTRIPDIELRIATGDD